MLYSDGGMRMSEKGSNSLVLFLFLFEMIWNASMEASGFTEGYLWQYVGIVLVHKIWMLSLKGAIYLANFFFQGVEPGRLS